ncbi:unnamed protein product [Urochloa humidicola]
MTTSRTGGASFARGSCSSSSLSWADSRRRWGCTRARSGGVSTLWVSCEKVGIDLGSTNFGVRRAAVQPLVLAAYYLDLAAASLVPLAVASFDLGSSGAVQIL